MILLVLGLVLWSGAHMLRRIAPGARAGLEARLGHGGARGAIAAALLAGLVLMVLGYRCAQGDLLWLPPAWAPHATATAMLLAVALLGMGHSTSRMRGALRHPMLTGVIVWALAHLLANGTTPDLVLFGGLAVWAGLEMVLINRAGPWVRPAPGTAAGDVKLAVITVVVYAVIAGAHYLLGPSPFGGG